MKRMTDEERKNAIKILRDIGITAGIESRYREKALSTTKDPENWILVMLLDMIVVGVPSLLARIEEGKERDVASERASKAMVKTLAALTILARDVVVADDFAEAATGLALLSAVVKNVAPDESDNGSQKGNQADFYVKNNGANPLW